MATSGGYGGATPYGSSSRSQLSDMTVGDYANGMPSIRLGALFSSLFRQLLFWVIPLTIIGSIIIFVMTSGIKRTYKGEGQVLVQLGSEYVYQSVSGEQQTQNLLLTPDIISLNEAAIMKNSEVVEQVIGEMVTEFGEERFAKDAFEKINRARMSGDMQELAAAKVELHQAVDKSFLVAPRPKSSIVDLAYKHEDGDIAVATLNAFIEAYLDYRRTIFVEGSGEVIAERRLTTEDQLEKTEVAIQGFLRRNGISDFDSERKGATERTEKMRADLNTLRAQLVETESALASVEGQLRQTPAEINLYVDDRAAQRVAQAELEMKQLLAKYLPGSDPVRAKQAELDQLKSLQRANSGNAVGGRRVGPNTVHQALMTRRNTLQSTADSLREKEFVQTRQLEAADAKVRKLQRLAPEYQSLMRERSTLDTRLKGYTNKEQEALVNQQQAQADSENVRVISYATLPRKGRNMGKVFWALGTLGWGFTLFMAALVKVFLDPKLYASPRSRVNAAPQTYSTEPQAPNYGYAPAAQTYIPEPVPAPNYGATAQQAYTEPYQPAAPAYESQTYADGSVAHDIYANPYDAAQAEPEAQSVPVIGTVPSSENT